MDAEAAAALDGDGDDGWSPATALRGDLLVLEQIEALEERVASASMQVKVSRRRRSRTSRVGNSSQQIGKRSGGSSVGFLDRNQLEIDPTRSANGFFLLGWAIPRPCKTRLEHVKAV